MESKRDSDRVIVHSFDPDEFAVIEYALMECYKNLKDYEDDWHKERVKKIKHLLIEKFDSGAEEEDPNHH